MTSLTISAAARFCGVNRRTLQRAMQRGRLSRTPAGQLTLEALAQAGYTAAAPQGTAPQDVPLRSAAPTPQRDTAGTAPQDAAAVPQVLMRLEALMSSIATNLARLCDHLITPQGTAPHDRTAVPHVSPQRHTAEAPHGTPHAPQPLPPAFDPTRHRLGKLCPRGHDWQGTGQSLRANNKAGYCLACQAADARARRATHRDQAHGG